MDKLSNSVLLADGELLTVLNRIKYVGKISPFLFYKNFFFELENSIFKMHQLSNDSVFEFYQKLSEKELELVNKLLNEKALYNFSQFVRKIYEIKISEDIFKIFENSDKTMNKNLLKRFTFDNDLLIQLFFEAFKRFNYLYSHYNFVKNIKEFEQNNMQFCAIIEKNGSISKFG